MEIKKTIKRDLNQTVLKIEIQQPYAENYQLRMLQENVIEGILEVHGHAEEGNQIYEYDVSGKNTLNYRYSKKKINSKEMKRFLEAVVTIMEELTNHLLNPNSLLLDPEYIYIEKGKYYFCYVPNWEEDIGVAFHKLMDSFVQWTDYQDVPSVKLAFLLHKETMESNYSLKKILEKIKEMDFQKEKVKTYKPKIEPEFPVIDDYDDAAHDWITHQELGGKILRETDNMWTPVKRFLQKHKRPKWGEWDGIYIDEDEL